MATFKPLQRWLQVRKAIKARKSEQLLAAEELNRMRQQGRAFQGWAEGPLNFPPTFKYKRGTSHYIGERLHHNCTNYSEQSRYWYKLIFEVYKQRLLILHSHSKHENPSVNLCMRIASCFIILHCGSNAHGGCLSSSVHCAH